MKIEIISHVWNYARIFLYQVSSLILHPPLNASVRLTVCCCDDDKVTSNYLRVIESEIKLPDNVTIARHEMEKGRLMRRAIGRNEVAKKSDADIVWFADCDMVFGENCLDTLAEVQHSLCFPHFAFATGQMAGDDLVSQVTDFAKLSEFPWKSSDVMKWRYPRAIGGIQIVAGSLAREFGYLPNSRRYQRPAAQWRRTHEDVGFRKYIARSSGLRWQRVRLPSLGRVRHSERGREKTGLEL